MGACQSGSVIEKKTPIKHQPQQPNQSMSAKSPIKNLPDPHFPDIKEWKGNRYKGIGIKRMKGYKCSLPIDQLNQKRNEFWMQKCSSYYMWQHIQQACIYDECSLYHIIHS